MQFFFSVTVIGNSSESDLGIFKGFMIQARANENGEAFGTFRLLPNDEKSKLFGCPVVTEFVRNKNSSCDYMILM